MKKLFLGIALLSICIIKANSTERELPLFTATSLNADDEDPLYYIYEEFKTESPYDFNLNIGYGIIVNRTKGISGPAKDFENKLSRGLTWSAKFHRYYRSNLGWGLIYSGYNSSAVYNAIDHNTFLTYIGPMFAGRAVFEKWELKYEIGFGYLGYKNNASAVSGYGEGKITGGTFGSNMAIGADYKVTKNFGIGFEVEMIGGSYSKLNYTNVVPEVEVDKDNRMGVSRINFAVGCRFCFGK